MYILLVNLLLLSHVLSDFYFQNNEMSVLKTKKKRVLILHTAIYFFISLLLTIPFINIDILLRILILSSIHFIIDYLKILYDKSTISLCCNVFNLLIKILKIDHTKNLDKKKSYVFSFLIDQTFHVIMILVLFPPTLNIDFNNFFYNILSGISIHYPIINHITNSQAAHFILLLTFILLLVNGGTIITRLVLDPYLGAKSSNSQEVLECSETDIIVSPENTIDIRAGRIIGILERIIIFILVISKNYTVIAIVIAAKTAVRFKDLEKQCFSEYYLIGTLSSIIVALLLGGVWNILSPII